MSDDGDVVVQYAVMVLVALVPAVELLLVLLFVVALVVGLM